MKIILNKIKRVKLETFADEHGLAMEVNERGRDRGDLPRFYAHFQRVEVKEGPFLSSVFGNGDTPKEAIAAYSLKISGQLLVFAAGTPRRREILASTFI